jgi:hypothetical protein
MISRVSAFTATATPRPVTRSTNCARRLYQPDTRSIEPSNHPCRAVFSFARSPSASARRLLSTETTGFGSEPAFCGQRSLELRCGLRRRRVLIAAFSHDIEQRERELPSGNVRRTSASHFSEHTWRRRRHVQRLDQRMAVQLRTQRAVAIQQQLLHSQPKVVRAILQHVLEPSAAAVHKRLSTTNTKVVPIATSSIVPITVLLSHGFEARFRSLP